MMLIPFFGYCLDIYYGETVLNTTTSNNKEICIELVPKEHNKSCDSLDNRSINLELFIYKSNKSFDIKIT